MEEALHILETRHRIPRDLSIRLLEYFEMGRQEILKHKELVNVLESINPANRLEGGDWRSTTNKIIKLVLLLFLIFICLWYYTNNAEQDEYNTRLKNSIRELAQMELMHGITTSGRALLSVVRERATNYYSTDLFVNQDYLSLYPQYARRRVELLAIKRYNNQNDLSYREFENNVFLPMMFMIVFYILLQMSGYGVDYIIQKSEEIKQKIIGYLISIVSLIQRARRQNTYTDSFNVVFHAIRQHAQITQRLTLMYRSVNEYVRHTSLWNSLFPPPPGPLRKEETSCPVCLNDYDGEVYVQTRCCYYNGHTACAECTTIIASSTSICPICRGPLRL